MDQLPDDVKTWIKKIKKSGITSQSFYDFRAECGYYSSDIGLAPICKWIIIYKDNYPILRFDD
jgi:hypothetical protein